MKTDTNGKSALAYEPTKQTVRADIAQAVKDVSALSDGRRKIVVTDSIRTDSGQKANAVYDYNTGITYVANDADSGALRSFVTSHEYIHSIEGTKEYDKFANTIIKEIAENESYAAKYDIDRYAEAYRKAHPDVAEETLASIVRSEVVADFAAKEILTNEDAIKRLVKRDRGLISRVYEWVKDKIKTLVKSRNGSAENLRFLRQAERRLSKALSASPEAGGVDYREYDKKVKELKKKFSRRAQSRKNIVKSTNIAYRRQRKDKWRRFVSRL